MSDEPDSLVLRYLRNIAAELKLVREERQDDSTRLALLERQLGQVLANEQTHYATLMSAFGRVEARLDRLERRAGLLDELAAHRDAAGIGPGPS